MGTTESGIWYPDAGTTPISPNAAIFAQLATSVESAIQNNRPPFKQTEVKMWQAGTQNITHATWTQMTFSTAEYGPTRDTPGGPVNILNTVRGVVIKTAGRYLCEAGYRFPAGTSGRRIIATGQVVTGADPSTGSGGTAVSSPIGNYPYLNFTVNGSNASDAMITQTVQAAVGDILGVWAYQESGATINGYSRAFLNVRRVA